MNVKTIITRAIAIYRSESPKHDSLRFIIHTSGSSFYEMGIENFADQRATGIWIGIEFNQDCILDPIKARGWFLVTHYAHMDDANTPDGIGSRESHLGTG